MAHSTSTLNSPLSEPTKDCTCLCTQYSITNRTKNAEGSVPCYCEASPNFIERSWLQDQVLETRKKANVTLIYRKGKKEDPWNYRLVSITTTFPGKVMEQILLEKISRHVKNKQMTRSTHHRFTMKSRLTNQIATCNEMCGMMDEIRAVDVVCLGFGNAFHTVPHNNLLTN